MPRGKLTNLTIEVYKQFKAQGKNRQEIAETLGLDPTAISKFVSRHRDELSEAGVDTGYNGKSTEMNPDVIDKLLKMNIHLTSQIERIVRDLKKAEGKESFKMIEVLIKLSGESRQLFIALEGVKSALDDRATVYKFFSGIADVLNETIPKALREEVFQKILSLRNAFVDTPEIQAAIKAKE